MHREVRASAGVISAVLVFAACVQAQDKSAPAPLAPAPPSAAEFEPNLGWLNTDRPLRLSDELKGHVVVLDFWTYCCINCMHILPDLAALEEKYKDEPVIVLGVHSAKFENEGDRKSIRSAVQRYAIHHPVVVDKNFAIWNRYGAEGWPSFAVIGADGKRVRIHGRADGDYIVSGEGNLASLDEAIARALKEGRAAGTLAKAPFKPKLDANVPAPTGLAFPGKVLAVGASGDKPGRIFIADSTNNRVIEATLPDAAGSSNLLAVFGSREPGLVDGATAAARFRDPQGLALDRASDKLYIADTKNHAIRTIDLRSNAVSLIVGAGRQGHDREGGKAGADQPLNSPWDLALSPDAKSLYIAMAGSHQLWKTDLGTFETSAIAGSGGEDLVDATAKVARLAQPSGLALSADGSKLYFADSEVSSIRNLNFKSDQVRTIIGGGLFEFGDIDGRFPEARLQHPLGVALWPRAEKNDAGERLLVADTYNHKIKLVDVTAASSTSWIGVGRADASTKRTDLVLDEPGGLCAIHDGDHDWVFIADTNNHRVVRVDAATKAWTEIRIVGLTAKDSESNPIEKPGK